VNCRKFFVRKQEVLRLIHGKTFSKDNKAGTISHSGFCSQSSTLAVELFRAIRRPFRLRGAPKRRYAGRKFFFDDFPATS
jgi:hypothetical protein